jgi:hypothetical protein
LKATDKALRLCLLRAFTYIDPVPHEDGAFLDGILVVIEDILGTWSDRGGVNQQDTLMDHSACIATNPAYLLVKLVIDLKTMILVMQKKEVFGVEW